MVDGRVDVVERADDALRLGPGRRADGGGAHGLGRLAPAPLQLVKRGVEFAPLAAGEEPPLQGVLQTLVVLPPAPPGDLGPGPVHPGAVEDGVRPPAVLGPLAY